MKLIVWELVLLLLALCAATSLILLNSSLPSYQSVLRSSSGHLLVFSVFNGVIFAILATNYRTSTDEGDGFFPPFQFVYGGEEEETKDTTQSTYDDNSKTHSSYDSDNYDDDDDDDDDENYYNSDGYDEDEDDDGSEDVVGWEEDDDDDDDDDEYYDDLETRSEEFIAKVIKGWKEEMLMENLEKKYVD